MRYWFECLSRFGQEADNFDSVPYYGVSENEKLPSGPVAGQISVFTICSISFFIFAFASTSSPGHVDCVNRPSNSNCHGQSHVDNAAIYALHQAKDEIHHRKEPDTPDSVSGIFLAPKTKTAKKQYRPKYDDREENQKQKKNARRDGIHVHRDIALRYSKGTSYYSGCLDSTLQAGTVAQPPEKSKSSRHCGYGCLGGKSSGVFSGNHLFHDCSCDLKESVP